MQPERIQNWWNNWRRLDSDDPRRSFVLTRAIFLRGLGAVYLVAFISLWVQIDGLIGNRGILPARQLLSQIHSERPDLSGPALFWEMPTLCWINSGDAFLHFLCGAGTALSIVLLLGFVPASALFLLWLFYLSLTTVGQVFLGYQWDALLLETGFLAIFFAPLTARLRPPIRWSRKQVQTSEAARVPEPDRSGNSWERLTFQSAPRLVLLLLWWLLFRLIFVSGLVKLTSGDPTWRGLAAMQYHYWTQPLPTWTSWYANLAPNWFQAASVVGVFFIELFTPLFIFAPRRLRLGACAMIALLQLLIAGTGNYGFFNLLTIVLCLLLIDDGAWKRFGFRSHMPVGRPADREWPIWVSVPLAIFLVPLSIVPAMDRQGLQEWVPPPLSAAWRSVRQFESVNAYGLFATMTTRRLELVIEGSNDGEHWLAYEFKWKPGDVYRRPSFCLPHMPRLDWQMWFAAISVDDRRTLDPWMVPFLKRLGEGSPQVLGLLRTNPFPGHLPRSLRIVVYRYRFTTSSERSRTGAWWNRELVMMTRAIPVGE